MSFKNQCNDADKSTQFAPIFKPDNKKPDILRNEVNAFLKKLKQHRASGLDQLTIEVLQATGDMEKRCFINCVTKFDIPDNDLKIGRVQ